MCLPRVTYPRDLADPRHHRLLPRHVQQLVLARAISAADRRRRGPATRPRAEDLGTGGRGAHARPLGPRPRPARAHRLPQVRKRGAGKALHRRVSRGQQRRAGRAGTAGADVVRHGVPRDVGADSGRRRVPAGQDARAAGLRDVARGLRADAGLRGARGAAPVEDRNTRASPSSRSGNWCARAAATR